MNAPATDPPRSRLPASLSLSLALTVVALPLASRLHDGVRGARMVAHELGDTQRCALETIHLANGRTLTHPKSLNNRRSVSLGANRIYLLTASDIVLDVQ